MRFGRVLGVLVLPSAVLATVSLAPAASAGTVDLGSAEATTLAVAAGPGGRVVAICKNTWGRKGSRNGAHYIRVKFWGKTKCNVPVYMTGHSTLYTRRGSVEALGKRFTATTTVDGSGGTFAHATHRSYHVQRYRVVLVAPPNQVWVKAQKGCKGVGTDIVTCEHKPLFRVP